MGKIVYTLQTRTPLHNFRGLWIEFWLGLPLLIATSMMLLPLI
jgi:hypothetical protein